MSHFWFTARRGPATFGSTWTARDMRRTYGRKGTVSFEANVPSDLDVDGLRHYLKLVMLTARLSWLPVCPNCSRRLVQGLIAPSLVPSTFGKRRVIRCAHCVCRVSWLLSSGVAATL